MNREERVWEIQRRRNQLAELRRLVEEEAARVRNRWDARWLRERTWIPLWLNGFWMLNFGLNWNACRIRVITPLLGISIHYEAPMWPHLRLTTGIGLHFLARKANEIAEGRDVYRFNTWLGYDRGITRGEMEGL